MEQVLEAPDLLKQLTDGIPKEEKHLIHLELMIMEQVQDWEFGTGKVDQESGLTNREKREKTCKSNRGLSFRVDQGETDGCNVAHGGNKNVDHDTSSS